MSTVAERETWSIAELPRVRLGEWPTPVERLPNMSAELGIELWVKRDDATTFALGGNKVRKLEFLIGDVVATGHDCVITTGGTQSNHARTCAAACARNNLPCYLVLDRGRHPENGNFMLDALFGATVRLVEDPDPAVASAEMQRLSEELRTEGRKPYIVPRGGSIPQGAIGYAQMVLELVEQLGQLEVEPDIVFVGTGSGGTHSGMMAGRALAEGRWRVQGVSVSRPQAAQEARVLDLSNQTLEWLGAKERVQSSDIHVDDRFAGPAYGVPTDGTWDAIKLMGKLEGIVLDPVYTGKAFAGILGQAQEGTLAAGSTVLFVHTGGSPALFAYSSEAGLHMESI